jgi:hypothetical protein
MTAMRRGAAAEVSNGTMFFLGRVFVLIGPVTCVKSRQIKENFFDPALRKLRKARMLMSNDHAEQVAAASGAFPFPVGPKRCEQHVMAQ